MKDMADIEFRVRITMRIEPAVKVTARGAVRSLPGSSAIRSASGTELSSTRTVIGGSTRNGLISFARWTARAAPALGEHTDEVLAELGIDKAEIARLRAERVV